MTERKIIKILTNNGFKYQGQLIEEGSIYLKMNDCKLGIIEVPISQINFKQELKNDLG